MVAAIVAAGLTFQVAGATGPNIVVTAEGASIASVTCRIINEADATAAARLRRSPTAIEWSCMPGDRLQCDAPALEPIDFDSNSCSKPTARLRFQRSGTATIDVEGPAVIEWRAETAKATRIVATRAIDGPTQIPVALGGRIIRLYRSQYSPASTHVLPGTRVRMERPRAGGELFGRIQKKNINPVAVALDGPIEAELRIDETGRFALSGLIPGDYRAYPVYSGGIRGPAQHVRVAASHTSELFTLVKDPVGGVLVVVVPEVCTRTDKMVLTRVQAQARSASFERATQKMLADGCEWHLEGLKPGRYEVTVHDTEHNDLRAAEDFVIEVDRLSWANVGEPRVVVEGRVTLGEKPGAHLLLAFERTNSSGRLWVTETDRSGAYRLHLDRPGSYAVEVRAARRLGADSVLARLQEGVNQFDLSLPETRMTVELRRSDARPIEEIVSVHIDGLAKARTGLVLPSEEGVLEFSGIPAGRYVVTADTNSGMVSVQPGIAVISKNTPEAKVTLTLATTVGELRLVAGDGSPIQAARVQVGPRLLDEQGPGTFLLKSVAPASELLVSAPGFVPICHVLNPEDFHQTILVMTRGTHAVEINFTPPISGPIGEISGMPGSTCPVPLAITNFGAVEDLKSTTVRIVGLPEGRFSYTPTRVTPPQVMEVPGPPLKFTRPPTQF